MISHKIVANTFLNELTHINGAHDAPDYNRSLMCLVRDNFELLAFNKYVISGVHPTNLELKGPDPLSSDFQSEYDSYINKGFNGAINLFIDREVNEEFCNAWINLFPPNKRREHLDRLTRVKQANGID